MTHIDLIVDVERRRLVKASGDFENESPAFVRGDDVLLRCRFVTVDRSAQPFTVSNVSFAAGTTFVFAGKASFNGPLLVYAGPDAWNQGDWDEEDPANGKCSVRVNFNSESLLNAIGGQQALRMFFDISASYGAFHNTLLLLDIPLLNDVHRGGETLPDPIENYPTFAQMEAFVSQRIGPGIVLAAENGKMAVYVNGIKRGEI
ncbi:MAG: hypothetical protein NZM29_08850 [Nitrospira sp.]|nr:hypothetical protein [Nitrospira sp.]